MKMGDLIKSATVETGMLDKVSDSFNLSQMVQESIASNMELHRMMVHHDEMFSREAKIKQATIQTAENTAEMKNDLKTVIHNQNDYIAILKNQNEYIKQVLENLFGSSEDSVIVQKEILRIMQESKPTDGLLIDKGMDAVIQIVFNAVSLFLKSKGIF